MQNMRVCLCPSQVFCRLKYIFLYLISIAMFFFFYFGFGIEKLQKNKKMKSNSLVDWKILTVLNCIFEAFFWHLLDLLVKMKCVYISYWVWLYMCASTSASVSCVYVYMEVTTFIRTDTNQSLCTICSASVSFSLFAIKT